MVESRFDQIGIAYSALSPSDAISNLQSSSDILTSKLQHDCFQDRDGFHSEMIRKNC